MSEVTSFLQQLDLSQYADAFRTSGFDRLSDVRLITESDLATMQVLLGHRRRLLAAISSIPANKAPSSLPTKTAPPTVMVECDGVAVRMALTDTIRKLYDAYGYSSLRRIGLSADDKERHVRHEVGLTAETAATKLADLGFQEGDTIFVNEAADGDIGIFGDHSVTPGIEILNKPVAIQQISAHDLQEVVGQVYARSSRAVSSSIFGNPYRSSSVEILSENSRKCLLCLLDQYDDHFKLDFKLDLTPSELAHAIGDKEFSMLAGSFGGPFNKIKLRRVSAVGQCINFHLDHSKKTMQVPLNGEADYVGGRLIYLTAQGVEIPNRFPGSFTLHDNTIVHGVSRLISGVRVSLFLLAE